MAFTTSQDTEVLNSSPLLNYNSYTPLHFHFNNSTELLLMLLSNIRSSHQVIVPWTGLGKSSSHSF